MEEIQSRELPCGLVVFSNGEVFIPANKWKEARKTFGNKGKYLSITYCGIKYDVHRLVAEAFVDNPESLPCVDHIDRDTHNNQASNLRWTTVSANRLNSADCDNSFTKYGIHSSEDKAEYQRRYRSTPEGRERIREYNRKARLKRGLKCA